MKPICAICGWEVTSTGYLERSDHCEHTWANMHTTCVEAGAKDASFHRCGGSISSTIVCVCLCHVAPTDTDVQASIDRLLAMERDLA